LERRYQGWWNVNMMGDYCWTDHNILEISHKRKSNICSFISNRKYSTRSKRIKFNL
jgi:hypothetical protein